ncbi:hypothetical protein A3Q56_08569 [Intoshia linei]|uniref:Amino acid permease/ SLC12A domain-containing protein n=1 Tax=Intoshia linei TaxID=1819745 RepID=A0A177ANY3_9BILA|nr:hypothetical protein A3Q56_08569 [Intoshia linei]
MNNSTTSSENDSKKLGLWASVFMIMGCIIGSGIFITPKSIVSSVNSVGMSIVIWIISGVLSILGALLYAELSIIMPYSGGDIYYAKKMFGDPFGFIQLWVTLTVYIYLY